MKNNITIIAFFCCLATAVAQPGLRMTAPFPISNLKELGIKGRVKEIAESTYFKSLGEDEIDTLKKPYKTISTFDTLGNELTEVKYTPKGLVISKLIFDYSQKQQVTVNQFDFNNQLANKLILDYSDRGLLMGSVQYTPPITVPVFKITFKYDEKGNEKERSLYFSNGQLAEETIFSYNEKNQKTESNSTTFMANQTVKTIFSYNRGNLAEEEVSTSGNLMGGTTKIDYDKFDQRGNWLLEVYLNNVEKGLLRGIKDKKIIKRTIAYY